MCDRRADLPEQNSQAVYQRMQTERQREAAEFRAQGVRSPGDQVTRCASYRHRRRSHRPPSSTRRPATATQPAFAEAYGRTRFLRVLPLDGRV